MLIGTNDLGFALRDKSRGEGGAMEAEVEPLANRQAVLHFQGLQWWELWCARLLCKPCKDIAGRTSAEQCDKQGGQRTII